MEITLVGSGIGSGGGQMVVLQRNDFNANEEEDEFHRLVNEVCTDTIKQRFHFNLMYSDAKAMVGMLYAKKYGVYSATKRKTGESVVIKVKRVPDECADKMREFELNLFEVYFCRNICTKCHPNIVQLNKVWAIRKFYEVYIEMEECETTLAALAAKARSRMPINKARTYMSHVFEGLRFCHANRIIHADIKPENLLVSKGIVKICDFDMSRESSPEGVIPFSDSVNDRRFLPLEVLLGLETISTALDIYAAGCTLIQLIGGPHLASIYNSEDRQAQLDRMHAYGGPIPQWYFDNGSNPSKLKHPNDISQVVGFGAYFHDLQQKDKHGLALDLLKRTFEFNQSKRISAFMALNHPFFFYDLLTDGGAEIVHDVPDDGDDAL